MPRTEHGDLTSRQVRNFIADGFVKIEHAFSTGLAKQCRDELWAEIGLSPDRPETWTEPVIRVRSKSSPPFIEAANTPPLHKAYDQLVGEGRWIASRGLGTFPIRFPSSEEAGDDGWHVDVSFGTDNPDFMEWRVAAVGNGPEEPHFPFAPSSATAIETVSRWTSRPMYFVKMVMASSFRCTFLNAQHPEAPSRRASDHHQVSKMKVVRPAEPTEITGEIGLYVLTGRRSSSTQKLRLSMLRPPSHIWPPRPGTLTTYVGPAPDRRLSGFKQAKAGASRHRARLRFRPNRTMAWSVPNVCFELKAVVEMWLRDKG